MIDVQVWMAKPLEIDEAALQRQLPLLSPDERERYHAFRFPTHRHHYLAAHLLLRKAIGEFASLPNDQIILKAAPHCKPYCETLYNGQTIEFSLTHTHGLVACAVSHVPVGIDAEWINRKWDEGLAQAVLTHREFLAWQKTPAGQRSEQFFVFWTLKEAYVKGIGKGLSVPFKSLQVDTSDPYQIILETLELEQQEFRPQTDWRHILMTTKSPEHVLALAINDNHIPLGEISLRNEGCLAEQRD